MASSVYVESQILTYAQVIDIGALAKSYVESIFLPQGGFHQEHKENKPEASKGKRDARNNVFKTGWFWAAAGVVVTIALFVIDRFC